MIVGIPARNALMKIWSSKHGHWLL